jgi:hypothetical protein
MINYGSGEEMKKNRRNFGIICIIISIMLFVLLFSTAAMCNQCSLRPPFNVSIVISPNDSAVEMTSAEETTAEETTAEETTAEETTAEETTAEETIEPSGYPMITLEGGTGYIFKTSTVVKGSDDRDIWWNALYIVPGTGILICSLGEIDSPGDVKKINITDLKQEQVLPVPGEVFAIKTAKSLGDNSDAYVVIRIISLERKEDNVAITIEYLYPFNGEIIQ